MNMTLTKQQVLNLMTDDSFEVIKANKTTDRIRTLHLKGKNPKKEGTEIVINVDSSQLGDLLLSGIITSGSFSPKKNASVPATPIKRRRRRSELSASRETSTKEDDLPTLKQ